MPTYLFRCPECKQEVPRKRSRKYDYIRDECDAGRAGRVKVRMKYIRTLRPSSQKTKP